ncbi:MAG: hypothetical protein ACTS77_02370 [Arsenophonus sp. NC-TX2-MAG3]
MSTPILIFSQFFIAEGLRFSETLANKISKDLLAALQLSLLGKYPVSQALTFDWMPFSE